MSWKNYRLDGWAGQILRQHSSRWWVYRTESGWVFDQLNSEELALLQSEEQPDPCPFRLPKGFPLNCNFHTGVALKEFTSEIRCPNGFFHCHLTSPSGQETDEWCWLDDAKQLSRQGYRIQLFFGFAWEQWGPPASTPPRRLYQETAYIYALRDPFVKEVRYIGKADHPVRRFGEHLRDTKNNLDKVTWIAGLRAQGQDPVLEVLEEVQGRDAPERELWWIAFFELAGHHLTNYALKDKVRRYKTQLATTSLFDPAQQKNLTPLEIAQRLQWLLHVGWWSFKKRIMERGKTSLFEATGLSVPLIQWYVALLRLPESVTAALSNTSEQEMICVTATIAITFRLQKSMVVAWQTVSDLKPEVATDVIQASKGNLERLKAQIFLATKGR